jgi:hypothetical protein
LTVVFDGHRTLQAVRQSQQLIQRLVPSTYLSKPAKAPSTTSKVARIAEEVGYESEVGTVIALRRSGAVKPQQPRDGGALGLSD